MTGAVPATGPVPPTTGHTGPDAPRRVGLETGPVIELRGLTKRFGKVLAVDSLHADIHPGRVTAFLGPNGSGKTTTLRMLLGLVRPNAGSATFSGRRYQDLANPIRHVGAVLEATSFHPSRRGRTHLRMLAMASGIDDSRVDQVLDMVGLTASARRKVGGYSLGMRQRLEIAGAMLGDPHTLILDEPSNGLDPQGIAWLRTFLRHLAGQGRTVLVSSHHLAEMAQTADDVIVVSGGQLRTQGSLAALSAQARPSMRLRTPEPARAAAVLAAAGFPPHVTGADTLRVDGALPEALGPVLAAHGIVLYELMPEGNSLEALFLHLTAAPPPAGPGVPPPGWAPPLGWAPPPGWASPQVVPPGWGTAAGPGSSGQHGGVPPR